MELMVYQALMERLVDKDHRVFKDYQELMVLLEYKALLVHRGLLV